MASTSINFKLIYTNTAMAIDMYCRPPFENISYIQYIMGMECVFFLFFFLLYIWIRALITTVINHEMPILKFIVYVIFGGTLEWILVAGRFVRPINTDSACICFHFIYPEITHLIPMTNSFVWESSRIHWDVYEFIHLCIMCVIILRQAKKS